MGTQEKERFKELFLKYSSNSDKMTSKELFEFNYFMKSKESNEILKNFIDEFIAKESQNNSLEISPPFMNKEAIYSKIIERINTHKSKRTFFILNRSIYKVAAFLIFALSFVGYFLLNKEASVPKNHAVVKSNCQDINPGKNYAILQIAGQEDIVLNNSNNKISSKINQFNVIKNQNGETILKVNKPFDTTKTYASKLITPRGGQYQIILSDGTHVWLNASSSITFPSYFVGHERRITLKGEAYFEVAKNAKKPFYVNTSRNEIKVLGTHFSVKDYENEQKAITTLLEGSIEINSAGKSKVLKPNEQAIIDNNRNLQKIHLQNTSKEIAWKDGYFEFKNDSLKVIMRQLERWYDVDISIDHEIKDGKNYTGKISKNLTLKEIMSILNYSGLDIEIRDRKMLVKKQ